MGDSQQTIEPGPSLSSREQMLLRRLADHYCGVYFIRTLEGFVHNLNGPLQVLWVRSDQLQQDVGKLQQTLQRVDDTEATEMANRMRQRIDSFVKGLDELNTCLSFLTKDVLAKRRSGVGEVKINEVIEDTLFLLRADMFFKHRVEKILRLDQSLPRARGRYTDLCVIVFSLIRNALEAMVHADCKSLTVETSKQRDNIVINIEDTGCGIRQEDRPHIFEPFFTKKGKMAYDGTVEEHAGLGLTLASLYLEECQGSISFESVPDKTTFIVKLPCET